MERVGGGTRTLTAAFGHPMAKPIELTLMAGIGSIVVNLDLLTERIKQNCPLLAKGVEEKQEQRNRQYKMLAAVVKHHFKERRANMPDEVTEVPEVSATPEPVKKRIKLPSVGPQLPTAVPATKMVVGGTAPKPLTSRPWSVQTPKDATTFKTWPKEDEWPTLNILWYKSGMGKEWWKIKDEDLYTEILNTYNPPITKHIRETILVPCVTKNKVRFLWPIRNPATYPDDKWAMSDYEAALEGRDKWVQIEADMSTSSRQVYVVEDERAADFPPAITEDILLATFRRITVDRIDHPIFDKMAG